MRNEVVYWSSPVMLPCHMHHFSASSVLAAAYCRVPGVDAHAATCQRTVFEEPAVHSPSYVVLNQYDSYPCTVFLVTSETIVHAHIWAIGSSLLRILKVRRQLENVAKVYDEDGALIKHGIKKRGCGQHCLAFCQKHSHKRLLHDVSTGMLALSSTSSS